MCFWDGEMGDAMSYFFVEGRIWGHNAGRGYVCFKKLISVGGHIHLNHVAPSTQRVRSRSCVHRHARIIVCIWWAIDHDPSHAAGFTSQTYDRHQRCMFESSGAHTAHAVLPVNHGYFVLIC